MIEETYKDCGKEIFFCFFFFNNTDKMIYLHVCSPPTFIIKSKVDKVKPKEVENWRCFVIMNSKEDDIL